MQEYLIDNREVLELSNGYYRFYGASQSWYQSIFKRQAGCGPTTATNQLLYLSQNDSYYRDIFLKELNYQNVFEMMNNVWKDITPGLMGVNRLDIYETGIIKYMQRFAVKIAVDSLKIAVDNRVSETVVKEYLIKHLSKNRPIAFLNLSAGKLYNLSNWHWVLIVGLTIIENSLIAHIYDEGSYKKIDLSLWLNSTTKGGGFVALHHE
ncbi:hypothetical protein LJB88_01555 [Erysipelotrichaceae bacterium OttesenSCG-928-M19]|nr:hypothetical protein [Erysipelotrichaceae bacterium OttesenSCG-928-M19]